LTKQSNYGWFICDAEADPTTVKTGAFWIILSAFSAVLVLGCSCLASETSSEIDIYSKLLELKPLPKVHYSWGLDLQSLEDPNSRQLYQLARITHSLCVAGEWVNRRQIDTAVYICARVNKTDPAIPSSIGVNYSPWHRKFGKDLPPTDRGPTYKAELDYFAERLNLIKKWVNLSNQKYGTDVRITALLLDSERFYIRPGDEKWNEGIREALDAIHLEAQSLLPDTWIEWYGRGITRDEEKWMQPGLWTGREIKSPLSCSQYMVPDEEAMRQTYQKTCALADTYGIKEVTPHVALGSGYRRGVIKKAYWEDNWDYDIIYSYRLGREINKSTKDSLYSRISNVVFFPAPFYEKTPHWGKHFIAYVRGATGVLKLDDLGYKYK
jgi:hypothetical protein